MKYAAFLRGVNVGGVKITMSELKKDFEAHGFTKVQTVLATGNVIFESSTLPDLSFLPVKTFELTYEMVKSFLEQNPFNKSDDKHIYVLIGEPEFVKFAESQPVSDDETVKTIDSTVYWQVPVGMTLKTEFGKILGKKKYQTLFTSRNINTIEKIFAKM